MGDIFAFIVTIFIIAVVVAATFFTTRWMGSKMGIRSNSKNIKVIDKIMLTPDKSIIIVDILGQKMALGMTSQHIDKICDIDDNVEIVEKNVDVTPLNFNAILKDTINSTLKTVDKGKSMLQKNNKIKEDDDETKKNQF